MIDFYFYFSGPNCLALIGILGAIGLIIGNRLFDQQRADNE